MPSVSQDLSEMCHILQSNVAARKKEGKDGDARKFVRVVDNPDSDSEVFYADHISAVDLNNSQSVSNRQARVWKLSALLA